AVDFRLSQQFYGFVFGEAEKAADSFIKIRKIFIREDVGEREHRNSMPDLAKTRRGGGTDSLRRAFWRDEVGMLSLDFFEFLHQPVIVGVGDFRLVLLVI